MCSHAETLQAEEEDQEEEDQEEDQGEQVTSKVGEWVSIDALTPWDKNPRINAHAVDEVAKSITRFGWGAPILARLADGVVIAGHTRLKAAQKLKLDKVPVRYLDLDPAQAAALALADNKLNERASWDDEALRDIISELSDQAIELDGLGWDDEQLGALFDEPDESQEADIDDIGEYKYSVIVECSGEVQQSDLMQRLESEGYTCQPLIS